MNKILSLLALLASFAALGMAQNCGTTFPCQVNQTAANQVEARNADDTCIFVQGPEQVSIHCYQKGVLKVSLTQNFWAQECVSSNFLSTEVVWTLCRVGNNINTFSWDVTAGTLEKTGTF